MVNEDGSVAIEVFLWESSERLRLVASEQGFQLSESEADFLACAGVLAAEEAGIVELSSDECREKVLAAARYCAQRCA